MLILKYYNVKSKIDNIIVKNWKNNYQY